MIQFFVNPKAGNHLADLGKNITFEESEKFMCVNRVLDFVASD